MAKTDIMGGPMSPEEKERLRLEYQQTKERYNKLYTMLIKYEAGTLGYTPQTSIDLLFRQQRSMGKYLRCLEVRAEAEHIDLTSCTTPIREEGTIEKPYYVGEGS